MAKKKKIDNRDPSINFRLPQSLKDELNALADRKKQTVSKYLRELIEKYLTGELYEEEEVMYKRHQFVASIEFIQLIVWMYEKRKSDGCTKEDELVLSKHISTLKKIEGNVPEDLSKEFDFVLKDLLIVQEDNSDGKYFHFAEHKTYSPGFKYEKLENYLRNLQENEVAYL